MIGCQKYILSFEILGLFRESVKENVLWPWVAYFVEIA